MLTEAKKQEKIALAEAHVAADRLVAGDFIVGNNGCSVGCDCIDIAKAKGEKPPEEDFHAYVADYFGTPEWLEHLRDTVFEGLPEDDRADWHVSLAMSLPVGSDMAMARHKILRDILRDIALPAIGDGDESWRVACRDAVEAVATLHDKSLTSEQSKADWVAAWAAARAAARAAVGKADWVAAWAAARAAARDAARDAAGDAAWAAAGDAAWAAARDAVGDAAGAAAWAAAWDAAGDAAWAAAWAAAGDAAYQKIAAITLKHLKAEAV